MHNAEHVDAERYLKPSDIAARLRCSRGHAYSLIADGRLRAVRIGELVRVPETELERFLRDAIRPYTGPRPRRNGGAR